MIKCNIVDIGGQIVKSEDFKDINDFLAKNYFQILYCDRNILTLLYIFQEKVQEFFIKKGFVYINNHLEFVSNREGRTYLKIDYFSEGGIMTGVELYPLEYYIDYEWVAK